MPPTQTYDCNRDAKAAFTEAPGSAIPRRPWLLSKQYTMTFVLSQDNEIVMGNAACKYLGDDMLRYIIAAVNAYSPNPKLSDLRDEK